jgi:hypothetical protein
MSEERKISYAELAAEDYALQNQGRFAGRGPRVTAVEPEPPPMELQHHLIDHVGLEPPIDGTSCGLTVGVALGGSQQDAVANLGADCPYKGVDGAPCRLIALGLPWCTCAERMY